jgi:hypothetical protein
VRNSKPLEQRGTCLGAFAHFTERLLVVQHAVFVDGAEHESMIPDDDVEVPEHYDSIVPKNVFGNR